MDDFKSKFTEEYRINECKRIINKYPERIPIIVCKDKTCKLVDIDKQKFLVPRDMNLGQFIYIIRKRIDLTSEKAIFLFTEKNTIPPTSSLISEIYDQYKNEDNFLYLIYAGENTFG